MGGIMDGDGEEFTLTRRELTDALARMRIHVLPKSLVETRYTASGVVALPSSAAGDIVAFVEAQRTARDAIPGQRQAS